jgi:hypothetical protein
MNRGFEAPEPSVLGLDPPPALDSFCFCSLEKSRFAFAASEALTNVRLSPVVDLSGMSQVLQLR